MNVAALVAVGSMLGILGVTGCGSARAPAARPAEEGLPSIAPLPEATLEVGAPIAGYEGDRFENAFYAPASLALRDNRFDLVIHFHGKPHIAAEALRQAELPAALVNVNLGEGSRVYREAYAAEGSLDRLVELAERQLADAGRVPNARVGRIAISSWSAGFGAAREIIERPADAERIGALLLVDGMFTDWEDKRAGAVDMSGLTATLDFARRAVAREKLFVLTHTEIPRRSYVGANDAAVLFLRLLELERGPVKAAGRRAAGGEPTYATDAGELHVWGFGGKRWRDHVDQHRAMGRLHYAELRRYWASDGR